jgi:4-hydroxy-tetrahydrodipicolinate synthase
MFRGGPSLHQRSAATNDVSQPPDPRIISRHRDPVGTPRWSSVMLIAARHRDDAALRSGGNAALSRAAPACLISMSPRAKALRQMAPFRFRGTFTALVTPFAAADGSIDFPAYERLLEAQIAAKIDGLVPCGTTGESPTLTEDEKFLLVQRSVQVAAGRAPVLAGIGANDTKKALAQAQAAVEAGADAVMLVMPAYSRPSQAALCDYVEQVAASVRCPLVVYNVPSRTAVSIDVDTLIEATNRAPNVIGLKDASGNVTYCQALLARAGNRISVLSGDDALTLPMMAVGAQGVISVTSNVLPAAVGRVVQAALEGRFDVAMKEHHRLLNVHDAIFCAPSPGPIKSALAQRGLIQAHVRPPLDLPTPGQKARVLAALEMFEA